MKAYIEEFIEIAKNLGWSANYDKRINRLTLNMYEYEDYVFSLDAGADRSQLIENLDDMYERFDPEDAAVSRWENQHFGLHDLLDDAEFVESKLQELNHKYKY